ncbi:MAG: DNA topoisomerase 4 subunit A [Gemmataceae bacterium]|nr:DNA topoisomerase 4 subunit A [Gemmataceae bacterium]
MAETIHPTSITEETRKRYLTYAMSVIMSRALPDVRDGLKPVQRRILYTMGHDLGLRADARPAKCARIVGEVMGKYHPHGDSAIYDALVRMSQEWVVRGRLVDGQGNFGSVGGDPPAAYRYTEAKLTLLAERLLGELRQTQLTEEQVNSGLESPIRLRPTYNNETNEPVVLPAQFPHLLVNGAAGIAVGLATNIPPHNLGEVVRACVMLIDTPEATTAQLLDRIKGPDFPLGGKVVTDRTTLRRIYEEGTGSIKVQGEWTTEKQGKKEHLVLTSIPYGVDKGKLLSDIGEIIESRKLPQLLDVLDASNKKVGLRITMEMKPGTDPNLIMAYLYKHTAIQENFAYNLTCLVPGEDGTLRPERVGLKAILRHFLDFRFATVRRRFEYDLERLRERIHILEGFRIIFDGLDKALKLIRESEGKKDAAEKLIKAFKLDEVQATAVLDAQLYKIAQLEIKQILDELKEKKAQAEKIEALLRSNKKLWGVVKDELAEVGEKFPDRRRTKMASGEELPEFDEKAYIVRENTNVVLTRDGWIKRVGRLALDKGQLTTRVREGDEVVAVVAGSTLDHVIFFADDGTAYTMTINEVPASSGYGEPITKFFKLADQVKVIAAVSTDPRFTPADQTPTNGEPPPPYILVGTAQGQTLRGPLAPFRAESTKVGRRYVKLNEGDRVVLVTVPREEKTIYLASANGHVIHFKIEDINVLAGVGKGVMGIKLEKGDTCLGGALMGGRFDKFVLETSGGKTMEFGPAKYDVTSRGGKGFEAVKRANFARVVPPPIELVDWEKVEGGKNGHKEKGLERNGEQQGTLFEE